LSSVTFFRLLQLTVWKEVMKVLDAEVVYQQYRDMVYYNGPLVKTTYEKNIVNKAHCLIPEEAA